MIFSARKGLLILFSLALSFGEYLAGCFSIHVAEEILLYHILGMHMCCFFKLLGIMQVAEGYTLPSSHL